MVSLPDNPNKPAVINDSNTDVGEISDGHSGVERPRPEPLEVIKNAALLLLGFVAFLLAVIAAAFVIAEILRALSSATADTSITKRRPKKR